MMRKNTETNIVTGHVHNCPISKLFLKENTKYQNDTKNKIACEEKNTKRYENQRITKK